MNIVAKYGLSSKEEVQRVQLPINSRILSVVAQHENIFIYVEQDVNAQLPPHRSLVDFRTVEFGIFKDCRSFAVDDYQFLGTVILNFGNSVYHVFYRDV